MKTRQNSWFRNACVAAAAVLVSVLAACAIPAARDAPVSAEQYRALLADPVRTDRDRRMDESRHPVELLQFAQVRPGMQVLDVASGAGYTSQLLALAVAPSGKLWAQTPNPGAALSERIAAHPQSNFIVAKRPFDDPVPPEAAPLDLVTLILNYHDISYLPVDRDAMNRKIFAALKPGGRYVIVDHSALPGTGITAGKTLHRIEEAFLIAEVQRAGFVLDAEGAFMRSAGDTREGSSNQATPPSDKFALRFVKPAPSTSDASSGYSRPPQNILEVMRSPSPPTPMVSPRRDMILLVSWQDYPSIARVATPYLRLAGVRVETGNHSRHDTPGGYGITPCARSLDLVRVVDGAQTHVDLPAQSCATHPRWSADGERFAFENIGAESVDLWVGEAKTGVARRVPGVRLNPMLDDEAQWTSDQRHLIVKLVPEGMGPPPPKPPSPPGPSIQESAGEKGQSSTYETRDTLNSAHDEALFDYYATSQLAIVDVAAGSVVPLGKPDLYTSVDLAPDGRHLLVHAIRRPYSYVTTYDRFAEEVDVWDIASRPVRAAYHVASLELADRVPILGVRLGPRDFEWRATEPATLVWAEALDGGDWNVKVPARDKVMLAKAPFDATPVEIARTEQRFGGFAWSEKRDVALLNEFDVNRHWRRTFVMDVDNPRKASRLLWDLSTDEKYADPGNPVRRLLANGASVVQQEGDAIFLRGMGSSPSGDRPFLDRLDLATGKSERLWRSGTDSYEHFLAFAGGTSRSFITWHQSSNDPPNAFMRTLGEAARPITRMPDPTPLVRQIKKRLVKYKRADGLDLSFTLYTPPGYREGTRVPTILYAYPLDYADASKAGQVTGSQEMFTRLRQYQLLLLAGYAIIGNASFPVIGDPKRAYDTYLEQLVADARAAVDEAVRLGVADPERIGVTGHSHGALMTVNLVAHSDLFRAGVATSGSYNKTLTPFGFQNERRSVWESPDVYIKVSPFFAADKVKTPLLIVHGMDDANPGTTPLQSSKLYEAIRGNGGTTRLVLLPNEPHWYAAMESNEQLVFEMLRWFDRYVKDAPPRSAVR